MTTTTETLDNNDEEKKPKVSPENISDASSSAKFAESKLSADTPKLEPLPAFEKELSELAEIGTSFMEVSLDLTDVMATGNKFEIQALLRDLFEMLGAGKKIVHDVYGECRKSLAQNDLEDQDSAEVLAKVETVLKYTKWIFEAENYLSTVKIDPQSVLTADQFEEIRDFIRETIRASPVPIGESLSPKPAVSSEQYREFFKTLNPSTPGQFILRDFLENKLQAPAFRVLFDLLSVDEQAALLYDMIMYAFDRKNNSARTVGFLAVTFFHTLPHDRRKHCRLSLIANLDSDVFLSFQEGLDLHHALISIFRK